eukprot:scaffold83121_cov72-Phaeocystis_antarctica.AAC.5
MREDPNHGKVVRTEAVIFAARSDCRRAVGQVRSDYSRSEQHGGCATRKRSDASCLVWKKLYCVLRSRDYHPVTTPRLIL